MTNPETANLLAYFNGLYDGESVVEGHRYQFLGCYILQWGNINRPTMGFWRDNDNYLRDAIREIILAHGRDKNAAVAEEGK